MTPTVDPPQEGAYPTASPFRPARRRPILARVAPITDAVSGYRPQSGGRDLLAAVTVAAVAVPSAMGYAEVASLSPVQGLYALLLPPVAYALLGSSRQRWTAGPSPACRPPGAPPRPYGGASRLASYQRGDVPVPRPDVG